MTLLYSFAFKRIPILDGFVLAGLFTLRLGAGIAATVLLWVVAYAIGGGR